MAAVSDDALLQSVKTAMSITGNHLDNTLKEFINEVKLFLKSAGISDDSVNDSKCIGVITRGVIDLYSYGSSEAKLSDYFYQRASQLALSETKESEG